MTIDIIETQADLVPPNNKPPKIIGADLPDDLRALGDRIASLSTKDANELYAYVAELMEKK